MTKRAFFAALIAILVASPLSAVWCDGCLPWDCAMMSADDRSMATETETPSEPPAPQTAPARSHCEQAAVGDPNHGAALDGAGRDAAELYGADPDGADPRPGSMSDGEASRPLSPSILLDICCETSVVVDSFDALVSVPKVGSASDASSSLSTAGNLSRIGTGFASLPIPQAPPPQRQLFTLHSVFLI